MKIACCETIESIEAAVMKAYRTVEGQADIAPEQAYSELKLIQLKTASPPDCHSAEQVAPGLDRPADPRKAKSFHLVANQ